MSAYEEAVTNLKALHCQRCAGRGECVAPAANPNNPSALTIQCPDCKGSGFNGQKLKEPRLTSPGVYQHYAGELYFVLFTARHTETNEELVIYLPLYAHPNGGIVPQARPARMWSEKIQLAAVDTSGGGKKADVVKRFTFIGEKLPSQAQTPTSGHTG